MMMVNSVAMFTIACSLFQLGFGGVLHSAISSENTVTSLPPIKMMNTTTSTIAPIIPDEKSAIQTVESSTALLEKIRDILGIKKDDVKNQAVKVSNDNAQVKQYFQLLKKNIELLDLHEKFKTLQSRVVELENDQTHQRNIIKEKDILISELSLGTQELSAKLYQSQQELLNITKHYNDLEKSYLTAQKKIETHNDELENEKKKHSVELLNSSTEISQLKEKNEKCMNQQEELKKNLETTKSNLVKNNKTQSQALDLKSAELDDLKQKNSIELHNLKTEVGKLKENNKKCTDQQGVLEKIIEETLSMKSSELENLEQKNSVELLNFKTEVVQEKDKNKKCMDQQEVLEKNLKTTNSDLSKNKEALSIKTAELDDLKQKHSVELLNLNTEISQLKEKNEKCMDQQEELKKNLETTKSNLVKNNKTQSQALDLKSAELDDLKQKNSIELHNLKTEVGKLKENNQKCTDQQGALEKNLITTESDSVENTEAPPIKTAELENHEKKSTAGFKWVEYSGYHQFEPGMVEIGHDHGYDILVVGRATHNGDILPAKVKLEKGIAYVSYEGEEYEKTDYEVLFGTHFDWVRTHVRVYSHDVPSNAFPVGETNSGEILYFGRTIHNKVDCAGKIDPKSKKLFIPYAGKELEYDSYEVLVMD